jgi:hypothetical protein
MVAVLVAVLLPNAGIVLPVLAPVLLPEAGDASAGGSLSTAWRKTKANTKTK